MTVSVKHSVKFYNSDNNDVSSIKLKQAEEDRGEEESDPVSTAEHKNTPPASEIPAGGQPERELPTKDLLGDNFERPADAEQQPQRL